MKDDTGPKGPGDSVQVSHNQRREESEHGLNAEGNAMLSAQTKRNKMAESKKQAHDYNALDGVAELFLKIAPEKDLFGQGHKEKLHQNKRIGKLPDYERPIRIVTEE